VEILVDGRENRREGEQGEELGEEEEKGIRMSRLDKGVKEMEGSGLDKGVKEMEPRKK